MDGTILPFSNERYKLTKGNEIFDVEENQFVLPVDNKVGLNCNGQFITLDIVVWSVIALFNIKIPTKHYDKISVHFKNTDANDTSLDNIYYRFKQPVPCDRMPGHHYIPYYTRYTISREGRMFDLVTNKIKKYTTVKPNKNDPKKRRCGYHVTATVADRNHRGNLSKHRALGLAYLHYNADPFSLVVNHIDGVGGNNELGNLEWTTYSGNTKHAYASGLQSNTLKEIVVRNTITGETTKYASSIEASRLLGLTKATISTRVRRHEGVPFSDNLALKYADSDVPWSDGPVIKASPRLPMACYNVIDNVIVICKNSKEAEYLTSVAQSTILKHIQVQSKRPWSGFIFRYASVDMEPLPVFTPEQIMLFKIPDRKSDACGALVEDLKTGIKEVVLLSELAKRFNKKRAYINRIVTEGRVFNNRYKLKMVRPYS